MLAINQPTLEEMRANLRAMKMNHGRANIERDIAKRRRAKEVSNGVGRFLRSLAYCAHAEIERIERMLQEDNRKKMAAAADFKEGVSTFLKSLSLIVPPTQNGPSLMVRCNEFTGVELCRTQRRFVNFLSKNHPRLYNEIFKTGSGTQKLTRREKELVAASVRFAREVAGEIIRAEEVNEAERLMGEPCLETLEMQIRRRYKFSPIEFRSKRRFRDLTLARQEFMWRAAKQTSHSLPDIGRYLGGLDHTTVLHGIKKHEQRLMEAV